MDRKEFAQMVEATQKALRRFLCALCCGDAALADDIAQEAYMKAYLSSDGLRDEGKFLSWLYRIAYNAFICHRRTARRDIPVEEARYVESADRADESFRYQALYAALDRLSEKERTAVLLYYMEGYAVKEIAAIIDSGEEAVKQQLLRGRRHLKNMLNQSVNEPGR